MEATKRRSRRNRLVEENEAKLETIDFKMVTFTLGGKDYGIDIMKVKEIAKFINFTFVPNTPPFVRGVYNLRGEIISIIDLREMFNLKMDDTAHSDNENGLILRLESNLIGVVVDQIDKVIGISSENIQPPHPIFGDINIKYISGVVENEGRLYIILDVERILGKPEEKKDSEEAMRPDVRSLLSGAEAAAPAANVPPRKQEAEKKDVPQQHEKHAQQNEIQTDINKQFVAEALTTFAQFTVSDINSDWFEQRYEQWKSERNDNDIQLKNERDALEFLEPFRSPYSDRLWGKDLIDSFSAILPNNTDPQLHVWNPGCGKGYESYSLACILKKKYPEASLKIWASDKDLLAVSGAPNLFFEDKIIPDGYNEFLVQGTKGKAFSKEIKDAILFEYHDIANAHQMPPIQLLVARDLFSYLPIDVANRLFDELAERMKAGGIVILGKNEVIPQKYSWEGVEKGSMRYYRKK